MLKFYNFELSFSILIFQLFICHLPFAIIYYWKLWVAYQ